MKIEYVSWGLGCVKGDTIYLSKDLQNYPEVKKEVLKHELSHSPGAYTLNDLIQDFKPCSLKTLRFVITHPKTWVEFLPINHMGIDLSLIILTIFIILGGAIIWTIIKSGDISGIHLGTGIP